MPHIDARSFDDFEVDQRGTKAVIDVAAAWDDANERIAPGGATGTRRA